MNHFELVADIGATNARFALVASGQTELQHLHILPAADYDDLTQAVQAYLSMVEKPSLQAASIAIAGPVHKPVFTLANNHWQVHKAEVEQQLGCQTLWLNDFAAQAWGVTALDPEHQVVIKSGEDKPEENRLVIGPGSGLGVAGLVYNKSTWVPVIGEGGHASFAPGNAREMAVLGELLNDFKHVSVERVASGSGIPLLYGALAKLDGQAPQYTDAGAISAAAATDPLAKETMALFFGILGQAAASAALHMGAIGGVYLVGGILPKILSSMQDSDFVDRFCQRGRFRQYMEEMPVILSTDNDLGLKGAALALKNQ
jgi:glucokinase